MRRTIFAALAAVLLVAVAARADISDKITQLLTGHFYASDGAKINRMADRLFVGEAVKSNGNEAVSGDWLAGMAMYFGWTMRDATLAVVPPPGGRIAITAGARTSDTPNPASAGVQTIVAAAVNDIPGGAAWAFYGDALSYYSGQLTYGMELDVRQLGPAAVGGNPYNIAAVGGQTIDLWLAAGGASDPRDTAKPNTAAIGIGANGSSFLSGIVFNKDALTGNNGITGYAEAIALPKGDIINWYTPGGGQGQAVFSTIADPANGGQLIFTDYGPIFLRQGAQMAQFLNPSSNNTALLIAVNRSGTTTMSTVHIGAANSCGSGKRCLTVDN